MGIYFYTIESKIFLIFDYYKKYVYYTRLSTNVYVDINAAFKKNRKQVRIK